MEKTGRKKRIPEEDISKKERGCSFSWEKLIEMKDNQTQFFAGDGFKRLRILDMDAKKKSIHMICELGKKTWPLHFDKLEELHDKIHDEKIKLIPYEIDRLMPTWGNFITGLFKYLECDKD
ncbi:MAG: hypothetical protein A2V86_08790 [Deltaproteobacteria bacterium RBG_16_49_23]|nr:MAG: hypothetical protein A2V86_08790 [Deltaproteobacteria bacterium RBG_16_49_23]